MNVKTMIKHLQKMPQNLEVFWADHDHGTYETNNRAGEVSLINKKEMTEGNNDNDSGLSDCFKNTPKKYVVIRP